VTDFDFGLSQVPKKRRKFKNRVVRTKTQDDGDQALVERKKFSQAIKDAFVPTIFRMLGYFSSKQLRGFLFSIPLPS